jgi:hypothetical protein
MQRLYAHQHVALVEVSQLMRLHYLILHSVMVVAMNTATHSAVSR